MIHGTVTDDEHLKTFSSTIKTLFLCELWSLPTIDWRLYLNCRVWRGECNINSNIYQINWPIKIKNNSMDRKYCAFDTYGKNIELLEFLSEYQRAVRVTAMNRIVPRFSFARFSFPRPTHLTILRRRVTRNQSKRSSPFDLTDSVISQYIKAKFLNENRSHGGIKRIKFCSFPGSAFPTRKYRGVTNANVLARDVVLVKRVSLNDNRTSSDF